MKFPDRLKNFFRHQPADIGGAETAEQQPIQRSESEIISDALDRSKALAVETGEPYVTIYYSESADLSTGDVMSFSEADKRLAALDSAHNQAGYDKVHLSIDYVLDGKPDSYIGCRFDIGTEKGGLFAHLQNFWDYYSKNYAEEDDARKETIDFGLKFTEYLKRHLELSKMISNAEASGLSSEELEEVKTFVRGERLELNGSESEGKVALSPELDKKLPTAAATEGQHEPVNYRDKVNKIREEMVQRILGYIENNPTDWESGWNNLSSPMNGKTGKAYRGLNAIFLALAGMDQGYDDPRWVTYNQAKELGANVKRGEKSVPVIFYELYDKATKKPYSEKNTKEMTDEERLNYERENVYAVLKYSSVFNAEQCHNFPELDLESLKMSEEERENQNVMIETIIANSAAPITYDGGNRAYYAVDTDSIHLPTIEAFHSMQDYYATTLHEIAHSTGHVTRLNRKLGAKRDSKDYAVEELRAELACVFLQIEQGIKLNGKHIENHAAYLSHWLDAAKSDTSVFYKAAADAQRIADYVTDNYLQSVNISEFDIDEQQSVSESSALAGDINSNIKEWYTATYPNDEEGARLSDNVTFKDLQDTLENGGDVYSLVMGIGDSVVRERLFERLAIISGTTYESIYSKWMGEGVQTEQTSQAEVYSLDFTLNYSNELLLSNALQKLGYASDRTVFERNEQIDAANMGTDNSTWLNIIRYLGPNNKTIEGFYGRTFNGIMLEATNISGFTTIGLSIEEVQAVEDVIRDFGVNVTVKEMLSASNEIQEQQELNEVDQNVDNEDHEEKIVPIGADIFDNGTPRTFEEARERAKTLTEETNEPYVTIEWVEHNSLNPSQVLFNTGYIFPLSEADKIFEEINSDFLKQGGFAKAKFSIDFIFEGKACEYTERYDFGTEIGGIVKAFQAHARQNMSNTNLSPEERRALQEYSIYFGQHKDLADMVDNAIAEGLPIEEQYDIQGYVLAARKAVNTAVPFSMYQLPTHPSELKAARDEAHAAGLPFSSRGFYDEDYNADEDFNPYVYDGSMSVEDYKRMWELREQAETAAAEESVEDTPSETATETEDQTEESAEVLEKQPENGTLYFYINEEAAERANDMNSYRDYKKGSATAEYRRSVDRAKEIAEKQKKRVDAMYHEKIDALLLTYARKLAENLNARFGIEARMPSYMITGGGNFDVRRKEKQNASRDKNDREWQEIQGLLDKIRSVGMGGISSDDPNSIEKLQAKLGELEKSQELMKNVNAYYRKHKTLDGCPQLSPDQIQQIEADMKAYPNLEHKPYATWQLSNNSAEIRRVKSRIEEISKRKEIGFVGWNFDGGEVVANTEANRLQILFDERPDETVRTELKSNGFRWSPKAGAWQRQLNPNAYWAADNITAIQPLNGGKPSDLQRAHVRSQTRDIADNQTSGNHKEKNFFAVLNDNVSLTDSIDGYTSEEPAQNIYIINDVGEVALWRSVALDVDISEVELPYSQDREYEQITYEELELKAKSTSRSDEHSVEPYKTIEEGVRGISAIDGYKTFTENVDLVNRFAIIIFEKELSARDVFAEDQPPRNPELSQISTTQLQGIVKNYMYYNNSYAIETAKEMKSKHEEYELKALNIILNSTEGWTGEYINVKGYDYLFHTPDLIEKYGGKIEGGHIIMSPELEKIYKQTKSPLEREYARIKANYPESIVFYRLGDFYEVFGADAERAAKILDLTLTGRQMGTERVPMAGVPYHAIEKYSSMLVNAGTNIVLADGEEIKEIKAMDRQTTTEKFPLIINLYGGPGAGKTTAAMELTSALKKAGYNVEYVSEYAKELVLEKRFDLLEDQEHVTNEQYHKLDRLRDSGVEIIVTDSPVLLGKIYGAGKISEEYDKQLMDYYNSFNNFNLVVKRGEGYQQAGRRENLTQAQELDKKIVSMLRTNELFYGNYNHDEIEKTVSRINTTFARLYGAKGDATSTLNQEGDHEEKNSREDKRIRKYADTLRRNDLDVGNTAQTDEYYLNKAREEIAQYEQSDEYQQTLREDFPNDFIDDSPQDMAELPQNKPVETQESKREWLSIELPNGAVGGEYGANTMIKMPKGEFSYYSLFVPAKLIKEVDGKKQLRVASDYTFRLNNDGRQVELTGSELRDSFNGVHLDKTYKRVAPSRKYAQVLKNLENNVPAELKAIPTWCCYRTRWNEDKGKKDKFIISPIDGKWASSKELGRWVTFDEALKYARENNCEGLSVLLDRKHGITCIDLDKCILNAQTGELNERATKLVEALKGTYIERSTSGNGLHIFVRDDILKNGQYNSTAMDIEKGDLEVFDDKRIMSMTGDMYSETNTLTRANSAATVYLRQELGERRHSTSNTSNNRPTSPLNLSDTDLINWIKSSKKGSEFTELYSGRGVSGNRSDDDAKLAHLLLYFNGGDKMQAFRIMRESGLYRPDKPDSYYHHTIDKMNEKIDTYAKRPTQGAAGAGNRRGNGSQAN